MTRKKVKLAFIPNDASRKATFKKRKKGLIKKVSELSTLCGVDACAIIYSPYDSQPEVWPNTIGAQRVLSQFKRMPEMEQSKKMVNQEGFIRQRIVKATEQLKKMVKDNREKEMTQVMYQCLSGREIQNFAPSDLDYLEWTIDQKLNEIYKKNESLKKTTKPFGPIASSAFQKNANEIHQQEQKPVVDYAVDAVQRPQGPQWLFEWMNNQNDNINMGGIHEQMMLPLGENPNSALFGANPNSVPFGGNPNSVPFGGNPSSVSFRANVSNPMWSSAFFP